MDVVKADMELIGVREGGEMEADDWPWPPLKETGHRRKNRRRRRRGFKLVCRVRG